MFLLFDALAAGFGVHASTRARAKDLFASTVFAWKA